MFFKSCIKNDKPIFKKEKYWEKLLEEKFENSLKKKNAGKALMNLNNILCTLGNFIIKQLLSAYSIPNTVLDPGNTKR